jgi:hypothetical protein
MQGIGEHISDGRFDRPHAGRAIHEGDFALLLVPYGVRHDPQPEIVAAFHFCIGHRDGAGFRLAGTSVAARRCR